MGLFDFFKRKSTQEKKNDASGDTSAKSYPEARFCIDLPEDSVERNRRLTLMNQNAHKLIERMRSRALLYGAIIGDVVGSKYEFNNIYSKEFPLFSKGCSYTDDTVMTIAVANALMISWNDIKKFPTCLVAEMQRLGREYPYPQGGYGGRFAQWLQESDPQPYNSFGNGSAMRVSACAIYAVELDEALEMAELSAKVTHNHPEGIKGAKAVAAAVFMARSKKSKAEIKAYIEENFYPLTETLDEIRDNYSFNETCQGTVPQAVIAFLESDSFEDAIRNAVSIGGDTDTVAAITGSIAWPFYLNIYEDTHDAIIANVNAYLPQEFVDTILDFDQRASNRMSTYFRMTDTSGFTIRKSSPNGEN